MQRLSLAMIGGSDGQKLKAEQAALRQHVMAARQSKPDLTRRTAAAVAYSRANLLTPDAGAGDESAASASASSGVGEWPWG